MSMKRLLPIFFTSLLLVCSCGKDASFQAELDKRNQELDQIEQEVLATREKLLLRIKLLREKLETLIEDVQASLLKRVEDGEDAVMLHLSHEISAISSRIQGGFAQVSAYLDEQKPLCLAYTNDAIADLGKTRDAIAQKIAQATEENDRKLAALLETYDKEVERVMAKARKAQASIQTLDNTMAKAQSLISIVENASATLTSLDSKYTQMEQMQLSLMEAVQERITDDGSLRLIEDEHMRDLLLYAESLISDMEDYKSDIQDYLDESDDLLSQLEDLESFIESDVIDGAGATIADAQDAYESALDLLDFFESTDPSDMYAMINEALDEASASYDNVISYLNELEETTAQYHENLFDTIDAMEDYVSWANDTYHDCQALYDEIMGVRCY